MLQSIRDRTHGWIAGVIISLVILSFALWGIHSYMEGSANNSVVAKVNGVEISKTQLAGAFERARRQMQTNMEASNLSERVEADLKVKSLETLINIQVLKQASIAENYRVSSRQIDGFLESMPEFQVNGHFSLPRLQQFLSTTMINAGEFLELIKSNLLIEQPRLGIIFSSFALPDEVTNTIALVNQERDIDYISLPKESFLKQVANVSADEIKSYYDAHQNDFKTPEQVSVEYVELSIKDLMAAIHPTDEMLKTYYNDNINTYTQPMQWNIATLVFPLAENASEKDIADAKQQADTARQQWLSGKDMSLKVIAADDDIKSRKWYTLNQLPTELQKPISGLTKAGDVSDLVMTPHGIVIAKIYNVKQPQVQDFVTVKNKVSDAVVHQKAEEKYSEMREKLANVSYEYPDSLMPTAKALGLVIKNSELFTADKEAKDVAKSKKVREAAFSADVLSSQNNSDVIQASPDSAIVLRIKTHIPAAFLPLTAVQKQIVDQLVAQKAEAKAQDMANEIKLKLQSGNTPEQIAKDYHATWNKVGYLGRYSTKVDSAVLYTAFRMPRANMPSSNIRSTSVSYAITKIPSGYAVVAMKGVHDGSIATNQDQYDVFADQVQNSEGMLEYKLYEQSMMKKAKIVSYLESNSES